MAVPTWRSQAAPSFEAPLRTVGQANKALVEGLGKISKGIEGTSDEYGDIVKNEAYNTLSNIMPEPGESRAAARQRAIAENPGAFDSSFLGSKEMDNLEKTLSGLDAGKKQTDDRNWTMGKVRELEGINPLENPDQARTALNDIYKEGKLTNRSDPDKQLESYSAALLRSTDYQLTDDVIERHGGLIGDESTLTEEVVTNIRKDVAKHVRKNNLYASEAQVKSTVDRILKESKHGNALTRGLKRDQDLSYTDRLKNNIANSIVDAKTDEERRDAINNGSKIIKRNPNWSKEDAAFMTQPIIDALDDMNINALDVWDTLKLSRDGNLKDQRIFLDKMYELYQHYFTELPKKVIDQKVRNDIKKNGTLNTIINTGNTIAELKADQFKDKIKMWNEKDKDTMRFFLDTRPLNAKTGEALHKALEQRFGQTEEWKTLTPNDIQKIYKQVTIVSDKLKKAFTHNGTTTLKPWQEDTYDLAIFRFLTNMGGYDPNTGFMNLMNPQFSIMSIDPFSDMAKADTNILMSELQRFLPKNRERTPDARREIAKDKSASLDQRVHAYLEKNPPVHKVALEGTTYADLKAFYQRYTKAASGDLINYFNPLALYRAAALNFGWGDPEGSVGQKLRGKLWKQFVDFQRIERKSEAERLKTTAQNKFYPNQN